MTLIVTEKILGKAGSQACLSALSALPKFRMLNTDPDGSMAKALGVSEHYLCSGYYPGVEPGKEIRPFVYCQDVSRLTFEDDSFDVVVTEDVLEHVRKSDNAFTEIYRVLKPGGCHVFTIPFFFDKKTLYRVEVIGEEDKVLLPPEYHYDALRGDILSYRTFGIDLYELLDLVGFRTEVHFASFFDHRFGIYDSFVFCSVK
ncbi:MAG: methyltransferase domain-containing protein [Desulfuromonadales bacterium]